MNLDIRKVWDRGYTDGCERANLSTVLYQCGLERDLGLFEAGDATEIGEKGLTLRSVLIVLALLYERY